MLNVVLYQPEIPPNTGNIIRLCANTGFHLHLIEPLGFELDDKRLRRAGLDYREWQTLQVHPSWQAYVDHLRTDPTETGMASSARLFAVSTRGRKCYSEVRFQPGDSLVFGPETRGLPTDLLHALPPDHRLRLPMQPGSRSLNLANAAAVLVYEAWRQLDFPGGG